jgi:hypothetical protein
MSGTQGGRPRTTGASQGVPGSSDSLRGGTVPEEGPRTMGHPGTGSSSEGDESTALGASRLPVCSKPGCGRRRVARGLCQSCYRMFRYRTDPVAREKIRARRRAYLARKRAERPEREADR